MIHEGDGQLEITFQSVLQTCSRPVGLTGRVTVMDQACATLMPGASAAMIA